MLGLKILSNREYAEIRETMTTYKRTLEDIGWLNLNTDQGSAGPIAGEDFKKMIQRSRLYYHTNPLAGHWVHLTTAFVFGEGISKPKAKEPKIQEVIDEFWDDPDNKISVASFQAQQFLSNKIQYEGNVFPIFFDDDTGLIRVRIFNTDEIADIIKDEDDRMRNMFYKISHKSRKYNFKSDMYEFSAMKYMYYPDWNNFEIKDSGIPAEKLKEDGRLHHIKINCDINDKFGIPELYRGIDWIKVHKDMAADLATLIKSLSMIAWKKKVKGTPAQVNALKTLYHAKSDLSNIGPSAGSTQIENQGIELEPINTPTGGAVIGKEGLRQMKLMVCAASGLFEHYFGDPSTGNLATATSMELPMVKKFAHHQKLWSDVFNEILQYQINKKIDVGLLEGSSEYNQKTGRMVYKTKLDRTIDIDFPPIIEKDIKVLAEALQIAVQNRLIAEETAAQAFLLALNINNVDEEIKKIAKERIGIEDPSKGAPEDAAGTNPSKKTEEPIKEKAIETPSRNAALRFVKKNNYVLQRMNGYRKALAGHFRAFQAKVRESAKASGPEGQVVGIVQDFDVALANLEGGIKNAARIYFPIAIKTGKDFLQSHLKESQVRESIFEAQGREQTLLSQKLDWNDKYVTESLIPNIEREIAVRMRRSYDSADEFMASINEGISKFESRIEQYAGAFWSVEEAAVKEAGKGSGVMVNFVGADDNSTCDGCKEAMAGNPYPIEEAPEPGSHECDGRCRHALQIIE